MVGQDELPFERHLGDHLGIIAMDLDHFRRDPLRERRAAPHAQGARNFLIIGKNLFRWRQVGIEYLQARGLGVPRQRLGPKTHLRDAVGEEGEPTIGRIDMTHEIHRLFRANFRPDCLDDFFQIVWIRRESDQSHQICQE